MESVVERAVVVDPEVAKIVVEKCSMGWGQEACFGAEDGQSFRTGSRRFREQNLQNLGAPR